ncbi:MAG: DNA polymerase III subunit beta [Planctomycetota bacterium]
MKLKVARQPFLDAVGIAGAVATGRSGRPVLTCLLMRTGEGSIELQGTDLEVSVRRTVRGAEIEEAGALALPAGPLQSILREARSEDVVLTSDGPLLHITSRDGEFKLVGEDPLEFPDIPKADPSGFVELAGATFARDLERVELAAARDVGRYAVNGVLFVVGKELLEMVATDGRRLAYVHREMPGLLAELAQALAPLKGVNLFKKSITGGDELVGLHVEPGQVTLRTSTTEVMARAIEGDFPDYRRVLGRDFTLQGRLETAAFTAAIRQAAIMAGDETRAIHMRFNEQGVVEVSSRQEGRGEVRVTLAAEHDGAGVAMILNPDFLVEFTRVPLPETLEVRFNRGEGPLIFRPDADYLYLVMPVTTYQ